MTINDGHGLFDKYGLIDSIITDLNMVNLSGIQNMAIIVNSVNKLGALKEGLLKEDTHDYNNQQGEEL